MAFNDFPLHGELWEKSAFISPGITQVAPYWTPVTCSSILLPQCTGCSWFEVCRSGTMTGSHGAVRRNVWCAQSYCGCTWGFKMHVGWYERVMTLSVTLHSCDWSFHFLFIVYFSKRFAHVSLWICGIVTEGIIVLISGEAASLRTNSLHVNTYRLLYTLLSVCRWIINEHIVAMVSSSVNEIKKRGNNLSFDQRWRSNWGSPGLQS